MVFILTLIDMDKSGQQGGLKLPVLPISSKEEQQKNRRTDLFPGRGKERDMDQETGTRDPTGEAIELGPRRER